jgi:uncharacterized protein YecT (DUF1311 family)
VKGRAAAQSVLTTFAAAFLTASACVGLAQERIDRSGFARFLVDPGQIEARYSRTHRDCMRRSGGITVAMRDCASAEHGRLDAILNRTYRSVLARLPDDARRATLREYQREWIDFRDRRCRDVMAEGGGGTASLIIGDSCHLNQTIRRTMWLETYDR